MTLFREAREILLNDGPLKLMRGLLWFVWRRTFRRLMPIIEPSPRLIDDVKFVKNTKRPIRLGDRFTRWRPETYDQNGEVNAHRRFTLEADHVCIIGGGYGVTTVHAARQVGGDGLTTVFEGGDISSELRKVAELNDVDDIVSVNKAIIGEATTLYRGMAEDSEVIDPADLPACDVLEMDCEGSELGILSNMQIRPRVLIIELHPTMYDAPNAEPVEMIEEMGYEMTYWSTQAGERMPETRFMDRLADGLGDVLAATRE